MKVSVIVTAYNYGHYIAGCLDSVLAQQFAGELEVVVIDDGSTDDTPARVAPYLDRVRYIRQENSGQATGFTTGFNNTDGEIVCYLDADDLWDPSKVAEVARAFEADAGLGMVHHRLRLVGAEGEAVDRAGKPASGGAVNSVPVFDSPGDGDVSHRLLASGLQWIFAPSSALSFRRSALAMAMPLPGGLPSHGDTLSGLPVALLFPVRFIDRVLGSYRVHSSSASVTRDGEVGGEHDAVAQSVKRAKKELEYLDVFFAHVNGMLERAGRAAGLKPEMSWPVVKHLSMAQRRAPVAFLGRALGAIIGCPALSSVDKVRGAARMTARALERTLSRKYTKAGNR